MKCPKCASDNVTEEKDIPWVAVEGGEFIQDGGTKEYRCESCGNHWYQDYD